MGISLSKKTSNRGSSSPREPLSILNLKLGTKRRRAKLSKPRPIQKEKPAKYWFSILFNQKTRHTESIREGKRRARLTKSTWPLREKGKGGTICWSRNKQQQPPPNQTEHGIVPDPIAVPDMYVYASSLARNVILQRTRLYHKTLPRRGDEGQDEVHGKYEETQLPPRPSAPVNLPPIETLVQWTATRMSYSSETYNSPQGSARTIGPILEDEVLDIGFASEAEANAAVVGDLEEVHEEFGGSAEIEDWIEGDDGERQQWIDDVWDDWGH